MVWIFMSFLADQVMEYKYDKFIYLFIFGYVFI